MCGFEHAARWIEMGWLSSIGRRGIRKMARTSGLPVTGQHCVPGHGRSPRWDQRPGVEHHRSSISAAKLLDRLGLSFNRVTNFMKW